MKNRSIFVTLLSLVTVSACHQDESALTPASQANSGARSGAQNSFRVLKATAAQIKKAGLRKLTPQEVSTLQSLVATARLPVLTFSKGDVSKTPSLNEIKQSLAAAKPTQTGSSHTVSPGSVGTNDYCDDCECPECVPIFPDDGNGGGNDNVVQYGEAPGDGTYEYSTTATFETNTVFPDPVVTLQWEGNGQNTTTGFQVSIGANTSIYGGSVTMDESTFRAAISQYGTMMFSFNVTLVVGYVTENGTILGVSKVYTVFGAISAGGVGQMQMIPQ